MAPTSGGRVPKTEEMMATGMVTFKTDREADTYMVLYESGSKPDYAKKHMVELTIADAATGGVPIAATLTAPDGVPADILDSADEFDFSMHDANRGGYHLHLGGSAVVD